MKFFLIICSLFLNLVACSSYVGSGEQRYLASKNGPIVVVPAPLTGANLSHFYDLPAQKQATQVNIAPPK